MEAQDSIGIDGTATSGHAPVEAVDLRICIIDYGMGNLGSVRNALKFLGNDALISSDRDSIAAADALILPGVGAFGEAMSNLRQLDIVGPLGELVVDRRKPFLGICLGMQLIAQDSTEMGYETGLGWLDGHVRHLGRTREVRLPHVGWSTLDIPDDDDLFARIDSDACFYFDHSYQLDCDPGLVLATCDYGGGFVAVVRHENIVATQFHPEKSQRAGLKLLRNFLNFAAAAKAAPGAEGRATR